MPHIKQSNKYLEKSKLLQNNNNSGNGWFNFFSTCSSANAFNWAQYFPKLGLMADCFTFGGFPMFVPEGIKKSFALALSFYHITLTQAQENTYDEYKHNYFTDSFGETGYKLDIFKNSDIDLKKLAEKAMQACSATIGQPGNVTYELIKTVQDWYGAGQGGHYIEGAKFWRDIDKAAQTEFENCISKNIDPSINTEAIGIAIGTIVSFCILAGCGFGLYKYYKKHYSSNDLESLPLNTGDKIASRCCYP